jgi:hypothetical protein
MRIPQERVSFRLGGITHSNRALIWKRQRYFCIEQAYHVSVHTKRHDASPAVGSLWPGLHTIISHDVARLSNERNDW